MIPFDWQWWRKLSGGRWATVTGWFYGRRWVKVTDRCVERVEEHWGRAGWLRPYDAWIQRAWIPFYCRFSWFYLMRRNDGADFIIVFQRHGEPSIPGWHIDTQCWTPRGCRRAMRNNLWWDRLMNTIGEGRQQELVRHIKSFKPGPQSEPKP